MIYADDDKTSATARSRDEFSTGGRFTSMPLALEARWQNSQCHYRAAIRFRFDVDAIGRRHMRFRFEVIRLKPPARALRHIVSYALIADAEGALRYASSARGDAKATAYGDELKHIRPGA